MREIKFRAWDPRYKTWHLWGLNVNPETGAYFTGPPHNELIHCQFTGLYDSGGVEIYEGDIVINERREKGKIVFANGCFVSKYLSPYDWDIFEQYDGILTKQTIIGNIYENPELLEDKK